LVALSSLKAPALYFVEREKDAMSSEEILKEVAVEVSTCSKCKLCNGRTKAVPGEGHPNAKILFIGEGPGYHEDKQGRPFVGPAGQFLDELLASINLKRSDVFITNVVKCRPPQNRDPETTEIAACNDYLDRQIAALQPSVVVTLGRFSMAKFFGSEKISSIHGRARKKNGYICIAMYHPAAGLHQASLKDVIRDDFKKIPLVIAEAERMATEAPPQTAAPQKRQQEEPPQQLSLF
jgi:uracil-DNA glycosylase family 4